MVLPDYTDNVEAPWFTTKGHINRGPQFVAEFMRELSDVGIKLAATTATPQGDVRRTCQPELEQYIRLF